VVEGGQVPACRLIAASRHKPGTGNKNRNMMVCELLD
jgi:hypothetical protein